MKNISKLLFIIVLGLFFQLGATSYGLASDNPFAIAKYNEGLTKFNKGYYSDAIRAFQAAITEDTKFIDAYFNLGCVYEYLDEYNNSIRAFSQVYALNPDDHEALLKLGQLYLKKGDRQKAGEYLNKIPSSSPFAREAGKYKLQVYNSPKSTVNHVQNAATNNIRTPMTLGSFRAPTGLASDSSENLYIASFADNCIYRQTPQNVRNMFSRSTLINGPIGLVTDSRDNLYVANYNNNNILKITQGGEVSVFASKISKPYYLYIYKNQLHVSAQGTNSVLKFNL